MLPVKKLRNRRSDDPAAGNESGGVVYVNSDYKPARYPDDVVDFRHFIIHEELPDNTRGGSQLEVFVRQVNSPSEFWINLCGLDYSSKLLTLCTEMTLFYEERHDRYLLPSYAVLVGRFCVCIYRNEWHRVKIVNATDKGLVDVFLIDCGSTITVDADNLRFMHKKFSDLPMQSFRADLADIKPKSSTEWPTSVCDLFRQETSGKKFYAKVVDVFRETYSVSLILVDVNGKSVSKNLLSNNMAEVETKDGYSPDDLVICSRCTDAPIRNVDHKDVIIAGKKLLLVTINYEHYFVLSDFLHAFAAMHEHVVLKLLETFPTQVVVEKMDSRELRVLLDSLVGRRIRGVTQLADRGIIPSVHLLPVNVACELLTFLGEGGSHKTLLRKFVSSQL